MSKRLIKILTICSLILVVPAIVVASAICLTTAYAYDVTVETLIRGNDYGLGKVAVKINGEEASKAKVQKDKEVVISFNLQGENAAFDGLYEGDINSYFKNDKLEVLQNNEIASYSVKVTNDMHFTIVYDADKYYKVVVDSEVNNKYITVGATGDYVVDYTSTLENTYLAKEGSTVILNQAVAVNASDKESFYEFKEWKQPAGQNVTIQNGKTFVANEDVKFTASFGEFSAKTINIIPVVVTDDSVQRINENCAFDVSGDFVFDVTDQLNTWKIKDNATATVKITAHKGYAFNGWAVSEANAKAGTYLGTEESFSVQADADKTYYAVFKVFEYGAQTITYKDGAETTKNEQPVVYGSALPTGKMDNQYDQGWKKFLGWKLANSDIIYTTATFDASDENIELTAVYREQKNIIYNFTVSTVQNIAEAGTLSYSTVRQTLDITSGCNTLYSFYTLSGLTLGNQAFEFDSSLTSHKFTNAQNGIDRYLMDLEGIDYSQVDENGNVIVNLNAVANYEWIFQKITLKVTGKNDQITLDRNDVHHKSMIDLTNYRIVEQIVNNEVVTADETANLKSLLIKYENLAGSEKASFYSNTKITEVNLADVLNTHVSSDNNGHFGVSFTIVVDLNGRLSL